MAITEVFRRLVKRGQPLSQEHVMMTTSLSKPLAEASWIKPPESLASHASQELQMYDEWISNVEAGMPPDLGDAIDRLDGLKAVAQRVLDQEVEL
jgi:hypothetical protein